MCFGVIPKSVNTRYQIRTDLSPVVTEIYLVTLDKVNVPKPFIRISSLENLWEVAENVRQARKEAQEAKEARLALKAERSTTWYGRIRNRFSK